MPSDPADTRPVLILHTGDPDDALAANHGSYAQMLQHAAGLPDADTAIVAVWRGERPQAPGAYRAALITGSPAMVTDRAPWSEDTAQWLRAAVAGGLPVFGICYGHQLLAHALGGEVGNNPAGREVGTQEISLTPAGRADALLQHMPAVFPAQTIHLQTVLALPPGARVLARSSKDPHQMVAWTPTCYSTQFHPEFTPAFIRDLLGLYAEPLAREAIDAAALQQTARATPQAATLVRRFLQDCAAA
ncbi:glutamine amidotransferase [Bordetella sp. 2513F-2]